MKLYYSRGACSLVVRIVINEIGLKTDFESVDLQKKLTESNQDYLKINPKGAVPALEIKPGEVLTENAVILQYLADTSKATNLLPPVNEFKRYRVLEWLNYVATEMHKGMSIFFNPEIPAEQKEKIFLPLMKKKFTYLDNHLAKNKYLMGNDFTLPDAYLFVILGWSVHFKIDLSPWKNLSRYLMEVGQRKAVMESLKQEKLIPA